LSINNIAILDESSFVTCSNDQKVKFWGLTPNNVVFEKAMINLNSVCVHLKYWRSKKYLFLALSDHNIVLYELGEEINHLRTFNGHERCLKAISIVAENNSLYSVSIEGCLK
jgi:WD40 repeat protein